jgi:hypothetical protein
MGHAGAIVSGGAGTAAEKIARFERAGVPVAKIPSEIPGLIAAALAKRRKRAGLKVVLGGKGAARKKAPRAAKTKAASKKGAPKRAKPAARKSPGMKPASKKKTGVKKGRH